MTLPPTMKDGRYLVENRDNVLLYPSHIIAVVIILYLAKVLKTQVKADILRYHRCYFWSCLE
jgi:hypothetical protein